MNKERFIDKMERKADCITRNNKTWFSENIVFEIIDWAKSASGLDRITAEQIEKKLKFLSYKHKKQIEAKKK